MRKTKSRCLAPAGLLALVGALTLLALPGTSLAAAAPNADDNPVLLAQGAGYGNPATAREVRVLQRKLRTLGWRPGPVDGMFGARTEQAVVGFQRATGLVPDGIAGPRTRNALDRTRQKPLARGAGYRPPAGSPRVRMLQERLRGAGFNPGPVDGVFGPRTQAAVERLQQAGGLSADGRARSLTDGPRPGPGAFPRQRDARRATGRADGKGDELHERGHRRSRRGDRWKYRATAAGRSGSRPLGDLRAAVDEAVCHWRRNGDPGRSEGAVPYRKYRKCLKYPKCPNSPDAPAAVRGLARVGRRAGLRPGSGPRRR